MLKSPVNPSDLNFVHGTYHTALQRIVWNQGDADRTPVYYDPDLKTAWRHLAGIHVGRCKARCCFTCCHFG